MSLFATTEAESFPNTSHTIGRGEFPETDSIYVHGIGVSDGLQAGGEGEEG